MANDFRYIHYTSHMSRKISSTHASTRHHIGVISDTHGLLRPEALAALEGVERIIHAGDIGTPDVLERLNALAPVIAVRGNVDVGAWAQPLPERARVTIGTIPLLVLHDLTTLNARPAPVGIRVIISGHSHRGLIHRENGVLFLNPGSAGPLRFRLPVSVARLEIKGEQVDAELIEL